MAQIKEILKIEQTRETVEDCLIIHLFQEGTFYRAYELSAWLCFRYIKQFKATHRQLKTESESLVLIGFPLTSLDKYQAEGNFKILHNEDKKVDIKISSEYLKEYEDIEHLYNDFFNWKMCVPLVTSKKKQEYPYSKGGDIKQSKNIDEVLQEIMLYPLENKTPIECMVFLSEIRKRIITNNKNMVNS